MDLGLFFGHSRWSCVQATPIGNSLRTSVCSTLWRSVYRSAGPPPNASRGLVLRRPRVPIDGC
jgi:hypothetical protein